MPGSSVYPAGLDALPTSHVDNVGEHINASTVNDLADAVNKIEAELGINPSGASVDVVTRLGLLVSNFVKVGDATLGADAASIDFSSIPATYAHLLVVMYLRSDNAATSDNGGLRFNGDTANNYWDLDWVAFATGTAQDQDLGVGKARFGLIPGNTAPAGYFGGCLMVIPNYANAVNKKVASLISFASTGTTTGNQWVEVGGIFWNSAAAINQLTVSQRLGANLKAGSRVTVYGLGVS